MHRDALAVALQFAAHVETGPRKQGCPSVPASRALTTLRRSGKMLGSWGERRGQKSKPLMQVPSKGEEFWAFAFLLSLGGCHNGRASDLYSVSDCSNLRASRCESATFCSDFRFLNGGTWHVFNGLITRLKNAKIARIAI